MGTNTYNFFSSQKYFSGGIKLINISYSHYTEVVGYYTMTLQLRDTADPFYNSLQTFSKRYYMNSTNVHTSQTFTFLTNNISSSNIVINVKIIFGLGLFNEENYQYKSDANDYLTMTMVNLANIVN